MLEEELIEAAIESGRPESALGLALTALRPGLPAAKDDALRLGEVFERSWSAFRIDAVIRLMELLKEQGVADDALGVVRGPLKPHFEAAKKWSKVLAELKVERLARELRGSTRQHRFDEATGFALALVAAQKDVSRGLAYLGSVLGSVENDQEAAHKVRRLVLRGGNQLPPDADATIEAAMAGRMKAIMSGQSPNREREFVAGLTQATLDLKNKLPTRLDKERSKEMVEGFAAEVRGLLAVGFRFAAEDYWPDITRLLVEFLPRALSRTGKAAGVEGRQYESLSSEAKRGCLSTLKEVGAFPALAERFLQLAQEARKAGDAKRLEGLVDLLGGLRNEVACKLVIEVLEESREPRLKEVAVSALGNIGSPQAIQSLVKYLHGLLKGRLDATSRGAVEDVFEAFGKITRNPKAPDELRAKLFEAVRTLLPQDERGLCAQACRELLSPKILGRVDAATRRWATACLVEHLWTPVQVATFASGPDEGPASVLGDRQKSADLLIALVEADRRGDAPAGALETIVKTAGPKAMRFSGAQMALGEIFAKLKAPEALPLLSTMIRSAGVEAPGDRNSYEVESHFDVASEQYVSLEPAKILDSLVFALKEIADVELGPAGPPGSAPTSKGGPACALVRELFEEARTGSLPAMGNDARGMLFDIHRRLPGAPAARDGAEGGAEDDPTSAGAARKLGATERAELMKELKKGGLFAGSRRTRKIAAMAALAQAGAVEALPDVIEHLVDKDAMVAAAAGTALIEFTRGSQDAKVAELAVVEMVGALTRGDLATQKALRAAMGQMNLRRPPCLKALGAALKGASGPGLAYELSQILRVPQEQVASVVFGDKTPAPASAPSSAPGSGADGSDSGEPAASGGLPNGGGVAMPGGAPVGGGGMSELDRKRALLQARREWIAGGKQGPEPKM